MEEEDTYDETDERLVKAATAIQSVFRGYKYRHEQSLKETCHYKAKLIQKTWRSYVNRRKIRRVIEILALFRIGRAVSHYRLKIRMKKMQFRLQQFDSLLSFYPSKSIVPIPRVKYTPKKKKGGGKGGGLSSSARSTSKTTGGGRSSDKKDDRSLSKSTGGRPLNRKPLGQSAPVRTRTVKIGGGPPRKRKTIVQLPPPWHDKDPKRLSQSQQDDLLFNQKSNIDWVKKELIPSLLRDCNPMLRERDELLHKNERYQERLVAKSFICPVPRGMKSIGLKTPKQIAFVGDGLLTYVASSVGVVILEPQSLTTDNIVIKDTFDIDAPLFDVAIHPTSGQIIGIDSHWVLRLFEHGRTILSYDLKPEVTLPKATKFLSFDKFGLLWVNLFAQRGPMLLIDPLTMQPTLQINLDNVASVHRFIRTAISITPLYYRDQPYGFIGIFSSFSDVYIFSYDFQKSRKLTHPKMKGFPMVKQANQRVFVWSSDSVVYVYELKEYMDGITRVACFKLNSPPTDICATVDPDMIYISCEDYTIHVLLGRTTEHPLRLSESRMERDELKFCDVLLGPITYTKSRNAFKQMAVYKFTSLPTKIAAFAFSDKMTLVSATFESGNICSVWMVNDSQNVKCIDFDSFNYSSPHMSQQLASSNFNERIKINQKKRSDFFETIEYLNKFDIHANQGLMNNMFNPSSKKFALVKYFFTKDLRTLYGFLPEVDFALRYISAYEVFHFLIRTNLLPQNLSTFSQFLDRFAPPEIHKPLPTVDLILNPKLPIRTKSYYMSIVDIQFDVKMVTSIVEELDPLKNLPEMLTKFTIATTFIPNDAKVTRPRRWLSTLEKKCLNGRLNYLSVLEDMVKHELMNRVQKDIETRFNVNMVTKIQPIAAIDIHQHAARNDARSIHFSKQPNRNPLLDEKRHKSIYDSWSKGNMFGKDDTLQMNLLGILVPSNLFNSKSVAAHFDLIRRVSNACDKVSSIIHSFTERLGNSSSLIVMTEDPRALPLSHYLTIHSFLGGTNRLITAARSIFSQVLVILYQLHKAGILMRTVYPDNILLNAANLTVTFGTAYDCQEILKNGRTVYLPLPKSFAHYSNPFLPPEYFHESPGKFTPAFDVWQFGMSLLYVITGFLPVSYGSELMKHLDDDFRLPKEHHVQIDSSNPLDDPPLYPRPIFFYDWMKDAPLVSEKERCTGDRGECFFTMPAEQKNGLINTTNCSYYPPTILELNNYKLLPFKNAKATFDESKMFIDIIAACLQIEPEKRPTVEELLKTYPFNQTAQITDILDNYMRTPDPNVFVSQFFQPVMNRLSEETFPFAIGIISSLLFFQEQIDDDAPYAFPLDSKATEKVIASLFQLKFIEKLVTFVLERISSTITINNVTPTINYENECFDALHKFFTRFVSSVEKGTGALVLHVDEVVMSLLSLYAGTPQLRFTSSVIEASGIDKSQLVSKDNAALYVYTHSKLHSLVKYVLDAAPFIMKSLKRTTEHSDGYFDNFLSFSDAVYAFAHALCSTVEKQRANAIKTMSSKFSNGQTTWTVRLFIDFHVFQKVIHCFYMPSTRNDACSFICSAFRAIRAKPGDVTYGILSSSLHVPTIVLHCASALEAGGNEGLKLPAIEIIRNILFGESITSIASLVYDDIIFTLAENSKDTIFHNLVTDAVSYASVFLQEVMISSPQLHKILMSNGIEIKPSIEMKPLDEPPSEAYEVLVLAKKVTAFFFTRQTSLRADLKITDYPIEKASEFLVYVIKVTLSECDSVARNLDTQAYKAPQFHTSSLSVKSKGKSKELSYQAQQETINELCQVIKLLFEAFVYFWRKGQHPSKQLIEFLKEKMVSEVPYCRTTIHPAAQVHHTIQLMFLHVFQVLSRDNKIYSDLQDFDDIWARVMHQGITFVVQTVAKETAFQYLFEKYPSDRRIRKRMFDQILKIKFNLDNVLNIIVNEMLWNQIEVKYDVCNNLSMFYRFPLRSEAMYFILRVLKLREKYIETAKKLCYKLVAANFLERERHLAEVDDNHQIVGSSIALLTIVVECHNLFSETLIKEAKVQLENLQIRFSRQIQNVNILKKDKNMHKTSPAIQKKEPWNKPLTALQKKSYTYGGIKTSRTARPATAFASTRKKVLSIPITPRQ